MYEIDLRKIDLNLLVVFDSLMQTRSVSSTAQEFHRTQSTISHALERLRQELGDPLLVRQGGEMAPSTFAEQLLVQLHPLLKQIAQSLAPHQPFDAATSNRIFKLAMRDFWGGLFPDLLRLMRNQAPHVGLEWLTVPDDAFAGLTNGDLDFFIAPTPLSNMPSGIDHLGIDDLHWASYARAGHPALTDWNGKTWSQWPHITVGLSDAVRGYVAEAAEKSGFSRQVTVRVPLFSAVAPALANSDLIATLPRPAMRDQLNTWGLSEVQPPFDIEPISHAIYWAKRLGGDSGLMWFRNQVEQAVNQFIGTPTVSIAAKQNLLGH